MDAIKEEMLNKFNRIKYLKLAGAVIIDLIGMSSYFLPGLGENADLAWAPISGLLVFILFPNRKGMAIGSVVEELLPFADIVPTAYLAWRQEYVKEKERTLVEFLAKEITEEQIVLGMLAADK